MHADRAESDEDATLRRECNVFTRYLADRDPDDYLRRKYAEIQHCATSRQSRPTRLDAALLGVARFGVAGTRIADAYARIFRPDATLRHKLILVLALAENSRSLHRLLTSGTSEPRAASALRVAASIATFALALLVGIVVFTPLRLLPTRRESET